MENEILTNVVDETIENVTTETVKEAGWSIPEVLMVGLAAVGVYQIGKWAWKGTKAGANWVSGKFRELKDGKTVETVQVVDLTNSKEVEDDNTSKK